MYTDPPYLGCVVAWLGLWAYWIASLRRQKTAKATESASSRASQIAPMVVTYTLLFSPAASVWWLGRRFVPAQPAIGWAGTAITVGGVGFAIWARRHLGANWSARVSIRTNHELVGSGPYRAVRHPIYTGMILAACGTALTLGEVRGLVAVAVCTAAFYVKARREEAWLTREFGADFGAHRSRTGMFLPRVL